MKKMLAAIACLILILGIPSLGRSTACAQGNLNAWVSNYGTTGCTTSNGLVWVVGAVTAESDISGSQITLAPNPAGNGIIVVSSAVAASSAAPSVLGRFPLEIHGLSTGKYVLHSLPSTAYYTGDGAVQVMLSSFADGTMPYAVKESAGTLSPNASQPSTSVYSGYVNMTALATSGTGGLGTGGFDILVTSSIPNIGSSPVPLYPCSYPPLNCAATCKCGCKG